LKSSLASEKKFNSPDSFENEKLAICELYLKKAIRSHIFTKLGEARRLLRGVFEEYEKN